MDSNIAGIISAFLAFLSAVLIAVLSYRSKRKEEKFKLKIDERDEKRDVELKKRDEETKSKLQNIVDILREKLSFVEQSMNNLENIVKAHMKEEDLYKDFKKNTSGLMTEIVEANYAIRDSYKLALNLWGDLLEKFIVKYYESDSRSKSKQNRRRLVTDQKRIAYNSFNGFLDNELEEIRTFKGNRVKMTDFIRENQVYASFESLCLDLERNGFKNRENELKDKFADHIDKFAELFITTTIAWESLELEKERQSA